MRVLLQTYRSRGDVEPMVRPRGAAGALVAEVRVCAPPDFGELLASVRLVPIGQPVRLPATRATPPPAADPPPKASELVATQFDTVAAAAEECDPPVATSVMPPGVWR
jgi:vancomycin aglycone glucosyltransferase